MRGFKIAVLLAALVGGLMSVTTKRRSDPGLGTTRRGDPTRLRRKRASSASPLVRVEGSAASNGLISNSEKSFYDLLPHLLSTNGWITDKVEGVAVTQNGRTYVSTDNDGVDD